MDEHDDDVEPEIEEGVEFEVAEFPILTEEDEEKPGEPDSTLMELDIDPDKSEI